MWRGKLKILFKTNHHWVGEKGSLLEGKMGSRKGLIEKGKEQKGVYPL